MRDYLQCLAGNITGIHLRVRERMRTGDGNAAAAGAQIQDTVHAFRFYPRLEGVFDQFGDGRARHQHPLVHVKSSPAKRA